MYPVRRGNVGYMYDRVSGKLFGNRGPGSFVLGPDIVPVEYLESTGTQWIDTGYYAGPNTSFSIDFQLTSNQQEKGIFGALSNPRFCIIKAGYSYRVDINDGSSYRYAANSTQRHVVSYDSSTDSLTDSISGSIGWDDHSAKMTSKTFDTLAVFVYKRVCAVSSSSRMVSMKLFSLTLKEGNIITGDYIPIRIGDEGAMMDTLTHNIYRNAGTGAFLYGNDLKNHIIP